MAQQAQNRNTSGCLPFSETSFLVKCEIPLFYDKHVEVKFSDRAGPGSHNGYTRGFPTNGVYTLKLQMEGANPFEYNWSVSAWIRFFMNKFRLTVTWLPSSSEHVTLKNKKHKQRRNQGGEKDFQNHGIPEMQVRQSGQLRYPVLLPSFVRPGQQQDAWSPCGNSESLMLVAGYSATPHTHTGNAFCGRMGFKSCTLRSLISNHLVFP